MTWFGPICLNHTVKKHRHAHTHTRTGKQIQIQDTVNEAPVIKTEPQQIDLRLIHTMQMHLLSQS